MGYRVRGGSKCVDNTRLTFVTTQVLVNEPDWIDLIDFVVVDEVHERNWQTDLLLTLLKRKMRDGSWKGKVVLMSATVEVKRSEGRSDKLAAKILTRRIARA